MRPRAIPLLSTIVISLLFGTIQAHAQEERRVPQPAKKPEHDDSWLFFDISGRLAVTTKSYGGVSTSAVSAEFGVATTISTGRDAPLQGIYDADIAFGGGDTAISGIARMYGWVGWTPVKRGSVHPFARLGTGFDARGNDYFLHSHADTPATQLGFRVLQNYMYFDAGAFGAYTGTGRFDVDGHERRLDGMLAWGGFLDARGDHTVAPFLGRAEYRSYDEKLGASGVRAWSLKVCAMYVESLVFCLDGMAASGAIRADDGPHQSWAFSGGLSLGVGVLSPTHEL
jgi:hypothetical protein